MILLLFITKEFDNFSLILFSYALIINLIQHSDDWKNLGYLYIEL